MVLHLRFQYINKGSFFDTQIITVGSTDLKEYLQFTRMISNLEKKNILLFLRKQSN